MRPLLVWRSCERGGWVAAGRARPAPWSSSRRTPAARPSFHPAAARHAELHRLRFFARQFQQRAEHAGVRAFAPLQRAEHGVEDVRHLAQEGARLARRLGGNELQHGGQVVRQLARRQVQPGLFVGLREVDHRRAAVARVAVHVLEQVQRGGAAAVEQLHVVGLGSPADRRPRASRSAHRVRPGGHGTARLRGAGFRASPAGRRASRASG